MCVCVSNRLVGLWYVHMLPCWLLGEAVSMCDCVHALLITRRSGAYLKVYGCVYTCVMLHHFHSEHMSTNVSTPNKTRIDVLNGVQ